MGIDTWYGATAFGGIVSALVILVVLAISGIQRAWHRRD
jgi:hypothetical protein